MAGHLQREFHYYWLREDENWTAEWYLPEEMSLKLPENVLQRLARPISNLVHQYQLQLGNEQLKQWIEQAVTTHFRIFGEYWLYFGNYSGDEYMPALTRSTLRFLSQTSKYGSVELLVMPFVGFAALKKVKDRGDLVERVIEWREGKGREVVEGLGQFQEVYRNIQNNKEREQLIDEIKTILTSKLSRGFNITLNLIKIVTSPLRTDVDVEAAKKVAQLSKSYRWLWKIREPELHLQWRQNLENLLR